jgi:hypothetical protein
MKARHDPWKLLARAAGRASITASEEVPFGFERRVLAGWRAAASADEWVLWRPALRAALVCATVAMLLSLALGYVTQPAEEPNELAVADSIILMSLNR